MPRAVAIFAVNRFLLDDARQQLDVLDVAALAGGDDDGDRRPAAGDRQVGVLEREGERAAGDDDGAEPRVADRDFGVLQPAGQHEVQLAFQQGRLDVVERRAP